MDTIIGIPDGNINSWNSYNLVFIFLSTKTKLSWNFILKDKTTWNIDIEVAGFYALKI